MSRHRASIYAITAFLVLVFIEPAHPRIGIFSMLELAEKSSVTLTGKVMSVDETTASVRVDAVLSGSLDKEFVIVSPIRIQHCTGRPLNFTENEKVLIFGRKIDKKQVEVIGNGQGKLRLDTANRQETVQAAKQLLNIASLDEGKRIEALLALVRSDNKKLRSESHSYIGSRVAGSEIRDQYRDELVSLIWDTDPEIQRAGLKAIRFVEVKEAIPRMAELSFSDDFYVVSAAIIALGRFDTEESVSVLVELTKHQNPQIRSRASIGLTTSRRPEAKQALKKLLSDENPRVRTGSPRRLTSWLRRNEADDVLPELVEMLNEDPEPKARANAAYALGQCRNSVVVPPLLAALKKAPQRSRLKARIIQALKLHYGRGAEDTKELIDQDIDLVISALESGSPTESFGPSFHAVGLLRFSAKAEAKEALEWAAQSHPNTRIRSYAERSLQR